MADRQSLSWRDVLQGQLGFLILLLSVSLVGIAAHKSSAEPPPDLLKASLERRVFRNYAGDLIMRFENYDFMLLSPTRSSPVTGERPNQHGPIVFHNSAGMRWDGSRLFLHPAYPYRMLERFRYSLNMIGEPPGTKWPDFAPDVIPSPTRREPFVYEPTIAYRSLPPLAPVSMAPTDDMLKYSPSGLFMKNDELAPQYRHPVPSGPIPTRPVSTVRVRPFRPNKVAPPLHDSLGTFAPSSNMR